MKKLAFATALLIGGSLLAQKGDRKGHNMKDPIPADQIPAAPVLSVDKAMKSIKLQEGFTLEAVASEPNIFSPVSLVFDGDGRMWVCEMNTYMPDVDGKGEEVPKGNIAVLEDTNGDGKVDKRTVFLDNVILPRTITLVKGGILYADHTKLYFAEVLDGLKLGKHEVVDPLYAKGGSLEHKPNTMLYGLDNWYYNAKSDKKYKTLPLDAAIPAGSSEIYRSKYWKLVRGKSDYRGQWGLSMDDYGRLYHNGNNSPAAGEYLRPGSLMKNPGYRGKMGSSRIGGSGVYSIRINPGVNRGYMKNTLIGSGANKGKLKNFTAASGNTVYRGDNFPANFYGMSLTPEPAGNLISARTIVEKEGSLGGKEIFPKAEILASTDERFRPVNLYTAPDGSLYIVDMYHGILQHKVFVTSYLRKQILNRGLDKNNNTMGRIYRLRWQAKKAGAQPKLSKLKSAQLVKHLAHANGWWRDTARRLIIESGDKSVTPAIVALIKESKDHRAQINALWTLEGLNAVSIDVVKAALASKHVKVKVNAIAVGENLPSSASKEMASLLVQNATNNYEVALQVALSAGAVQDSQSLVALKTVLDKFSSKKYIREAAISGLTGRETEFRELIGDYKDKKFMGMLSKVGVKKKVVDGRKKLDSKGKKIFDAGKELYHGRATCFGCHSPKGEGMPNMGPPLVKSEWVTGSQERLAKVMLHGLMGPIKVNNKVYKTPMIMPGLGANASFKDSDLAAIATYIRNEWGNTAGVVKASVFKTVREQTKARNTPYNAKDLK